MFLKKISFIVVLSMYLSLVACSTNTNMSNQNQDSAEQIKPDELVWIDDIADVKISTNYFTNVTKEEEEYIKKILSCLYNAQIYQTNIELLEKIDVNSFENFNICYELTRSYLDCLNAVIFYKLAHDRKCTDGVKFSILTQANEFVKSSLYWIHKNYYIDLNINPLKIGAEKAITLSVGEKIDCNERFSQSYQNSKNVNKVVLNEERYTSLYYPKEIHINSKTLGAVYCDVSLIDLVNTGKFGDTARLTFEFKAKKYDEYPTENSKHTELPFLIYGSVSDPFFVKPSYSESVLETINKLTIGDSLCLEYKLDLSQMTNIENDFYVLFYDENVNFVNYNFN